MLRHNLLVTYRNFIRSKGSFLINLFGLSTSLACSILIFLWVQLETGYDRFNVHADHIYRVTASIRGEKGALSCYPLAAAIKEEIPEIKNTARLRSNFGGVTVLNVGGQKFDERSVFYADPTFFEVFSFPLIEGNKETALAKPDGLVITRQMAQKYFGGDKALGKTIRINNTNDLTVTGVLQDIPTNSHLQFDILLPMSLRERTDESIINNLWDNFNFYTYAQLNDDIEVSVTSLESMETRINELFKRNTSSFAADFSLQPLTRIHLHSNFKFDVDGQGSIQHVRIFSIAAILVLLVACINFMNLTTAASIRRSREVGVRKTIGADRAGLIRQFLGESLIMTFIAFLLASLLVIIMLPTFNEVSGKNLTITRFDVKILTGLFVMFFTTALISGSYPSFYLSGLRPAQVLKGAITKVGRANLFFRNVLVVFQFSVSIALLVGTMLIYKQLRFIQERNLGYDKENLLYVPLKGEMGRGVKTLRDKLESNSSLMEYSIISELPTNLETATIGVMWDGKDPDARPMFSIMGVDHRSLDVFKMQLLAGRGFSQYFQTDSTNYVVNEKTLQTLGVDKAAAIGRPLTLFGNKGTIIGVVRDFNFKPAQQPIEPIIIRLNSRSGYLAVRTKPGSVSKTIEQLEGIWQSLDSPYAFEYGFVDQDLDKLYLTERRIGTLFNAFAVLAIIISCLGLSGLVAFISEQRTKEIGIRKVFGASVFNIIIVLTMTFLKLVLVAFLIASPLAWYGINKWLEAYAYRINIDWWVFGLAGIFALLIAVCTIVFQSAKTVLMNPVQSLRSE